MIPCADYHESASCTGSSDCRKVSDLCVNSLCKTTGLVGTTCTNTPDCQEFHQCLPTGCQLGPTLNQNCANAPCRTGYCDATTMVCTPPKADDAACDPQLYSGRDCASGYCDTTMGNPKCGPDPICF